MTSAPNNPSMWVRNGPAQNEVKSATRRPARGSAVGSAEPSGRGRAGAAGGGTAAPAGGGAARGAGAAGDGTAAPAGRVAVRMGGPSFGAGSFSPTPGIGGCIRNGGAGCVNP